MFVFCCRKMTPQLNRGLKFNLPSRRTPHLDLPDLMLQPFEYNITLHPYSIAGRTFSSGPSERDGAFFCPVDPRRDRKHVTGLPVVYRNGPEALTFPLSVAVHLKRLPRREYIIFYVAPCGRMSDARNCEERHFVSCSFKMAPVLSASVDWE